MRNALYRGVYAGHRGAHLGRAAYLLQEVVDDGPLVVVRHQPLGFDEDVARKAPRAEQVDDVVVESKHRLVKLRHD